MKEGDNKESREKSSTRMNHTSLLSFHTEIFFMVSMEKSTPNLSLYGHTKTHDFLPFSFFMAHRKSSILGSKYMIWHFQADVRIMPFPRKSSHIIPMSLPIENVLPPPPPLPILSLVGGDSY